MKDEDEINDVEDVFRTFPKHSLALPSAQPVASDLMPLPEQLEPLMLLPKQLSGHIDDNSGFAGGLPKGGKQVNLVDHVILKRHQYLSSYGYHNETLQR